MSFTNSELQELKALLLELEKSLPLDIENTKKSAQPVELDQTAFGRVSRVDAIQQQQMQKASLERMEQRLKLVRQAIERADTESFGLCSICEEPISFQRLKARPESALCIDCAKK